MNRIIVLIIFLTWTLNMFGQFLFSNEEGKNERPLDSMLFSERLVYGGFGGLNAGSGFFFLQLNPQVGYQVTDQATVGVNGNIYFWQNQSNESFRYSALGPSLFARYQFLNILFVQAEPELLYIRRRINFQRENEILTQDFVPGFLLGGGLILSSGGKSYSSISVMFNFIDGNQRPYRDPQIRFGFHYGF